MCGLWASVGFEPPAAAIDRVAHRGPDAAGSLDVPSPLGPVALRFRRLSIFDLDARASQPMRRGPARPAIVFNGAIYNFQALRRELEAAGHVFTTMSDTEVLLAAYEEWGTACLPRLDGMFAFIIADPRRNTLFAARDRFGIKPLYLWAGRVGGRAAVAFSSEIKQLLTVAPPPRAHRAALHDFLMFGTTDHGAVTCFDGIVPVRPGHSVEMDLTAPPQTTADAVRQSAWYRLPPPPTRIPPADEAIAALCERFCTSIEHHLAADVPVGSCLSGGIDSSAIVGAVATLRPAAERHAVSAIFPGEAVDESRYVTAVATRWPGLVSHRVTPDPTALVDTLDALVWHQDEPFASTSLFAQWNVFQEARRNGLTVMLDGQGADEVFAGYRPMYGAALADRLKRAGAGAALADMKSLTAASGIGAMRQGLWLAAALAPAAVTTRARGLARHLGAASFVRDAAGDFAVATPAVDGDGALDTLCRRMLTSTSVPMLLRFEDRNSMAHGIEARVPFLDHHLVETALAFAARYDVVDGQSKWVLRQAVRPYLPDAVAERRDKIGFATPEERWFKGALRPAAEAAIEQAVTTLSPVVDADRVRRQMREQLDGRRRYDGSLWRLWSASLWARRFNVSVA